MSGTAHLLLTVGLALSLAFVIWVLVFGPDSVIADAVFGNLITSVLFAILMLGSFGGLLAELARLIPKGMTADGADRWERIRQKGKSVHVGTYVLFFSLPLVLPLAFVLFFRANRSFSESLIGFLIVTIVFETCIVLLAFREWAENEKQYLEFRSKLQDSAKPQNE
jgi:hypothetical protein